MKKLLIAVLLPLAYAAFFGAIAGKINSPEVFGTAAIQYGSTAFVALACPICLLLSLSLTLNGRRLLGPLLALLSALPVVIAILLSCILPAFLCRASSTLLQPQFYEIDAIAHSTTSARDPSKDLAEREKAAAVLYRAWNVTPVILDSSNVLRPYVPTDLDQTERETNRQLRKQQEATGAFVNETLRQIPWIVALYLTAFSLIFGGGVALHVLRRPAVAITSPEK